MAKKRGTWGTDMNYVREVIRLHYELKKNRNEIAQSLGISHATVTRILGLARDRGGEPWTHLYLAAYHCVSVLWNFMLGPLFWSVGGSRDREC